MDESKTRRGVITGTTPDYVYTDEDEILNEFLKDAVFLKDSPDKDNYHFIKLRQIFGAVFAWVLSAVPIAIIIFELRFDYYGGPKPFFYLPQTKRFFLSFSREILITLIVVILSVFVLVVYRHFFLKFYYSRENKPWNGVLKEIGYQKQAIDYHFGSAFAEHEENAGWIAVQPEDNVEATEIEEAYEELLPEFRENDAFSTDEDDDLLTSY